MTDEERVIECQREIGRLRYLVRSYEAAITTEIESIQAASNEAAQKMRAAGEGDDTDVFNDSIADYKNAKVREHAVVDALMRIQNA